MRIHESMAHSGSASIVRDGDVPPVLLRPDSPTLIIEEQVLSDFEDAHEEDSETSPTRRRPGDLSVTRGRPQRGGLLTAPTHNPEDGLTDTEMMSEEDEEVVDGNGGGVSQEVVDAVNLTLDEVLRDYRDEGELNIRDTSGQLTVVSRQSRTRSSLTPGDAGGVEEVLTDMEDIEGELGDDEDQLYIAEDEGGQSSYCSMEPSSTVQVTEKEKAGPKRYSLTEFLKLPNEEEACHTDVEDLEDNENGDSTDSDGRRKSSLQVNACRQRIVITPELPVDPGTDVESLRSSPDRRRMSAGTKALYDQVMATLSANPEGGRCISPSDCGDPPLYENITDEEDLIPESSRRMSSSTSFLKPATNQDDVSGGITDCEDFQDSDGEVEQEVRSKKLKRQAQEKEDDAAFEKAFVASIIASAQTSIIVKEKDGGVEGAIVEETMTDDDEIHTEDVDKKQLTPRLVLYHTPNRGLGGEDSEDEGFGVGGGITDTEDFSFAAGHGLEDEALGGEAKCSEDQEKLVQTLMEGSASCVRVKDKEQIPGTSNKSSSSGGDRRQSSGLHVNFDNGQDDPETDMEDLGDIMTPSCDQVQIVISPGSPGHSGNNSGGGIIAASSRKKTRKRHNRATKANASSSKEQ